MKGLLVRIAVDSSYGEWNAPVNPENHDFVYVSIPETFTHKFKVGMITKYDEFTDTVHKFNERNNSTKQVEFPEQLLGVKTHLDPDFKYLTYGDSGKRRGKKLNDLFKADDFIVFYAGLKPISVYEYPLMYAIIGFYKIKKILNTVDVGSADAIKNAHTRIVKPEPSDVIVFGKKGVSGRLEYCIPIGEYRENAYRVRTSLLNIWGGISTKNGYLQRSVVPPTFNNPEKFLKWFEKQNVKLINDNN